MAVTNLHTPQSNHADRIGRFALDAIKAAAATMIDESDPQRGTIKLRVGFHSGPVVANVVGTKNPRCALLAVLGALRRAAGSYWLVLDLLTLHRAQLSTTFFRLPVWRHSQHGVAHGELERGHAGAPEWCGARAACSGEEQACVHLARRC